MPGIGNYPVSSGAPTILIRPGQSRALFIVNTGSTTVYIASRLSDCNTLNGMPLASGSTKQWLAGDECYAICASGITGTLNLSENAGNLNDPSAIGRAIYVSGIPPVDNRTLLFGQTLIGTGFTSSKIQVSSYVSMLFYFEPTFAVTPDNYTVTIDWFPDSTSSIPAWQDTLLIGENADPTSALIPVKGSYVRFTVTATAGTAGIKLYGSYSQQKQQYLCSGANSATGGTIVGRGMTGMQQWTGTIPVSTTWTWTPDILGGPVRLVFRCGSAGPHNVNITIRGKQSTLAVLDSEIGIAVVTNTQLVLDWTNPAEPLDVIIENTSAANTMAIRAVLLSQNPWGF